MTKTQFILFDAPCRVVRAKYTDGDAYASFEIFIPQLWADKIEPGMEPEDINKALLQWDLEFSGSVKFDGCSNWHSGHCSLHFCEAGDALRLAEIIEDCRVRASALIPGFIG